MNYRAPTVVTACVKIENFMILQINMTTAASGKSFCKTAANKAVIELSLAADAPQISDIAGPALPIIS